MKKLVVILSLFIGFIGCEQEKEEALRIQWTSNSPEAIALFEEFMMIQEKRAWDPESQENLMDSIMKLDPDFVIAKAFNTFGTIEEQRSNFLSAYDNRDKVSKLESDFLESLFQLRIQGNRSNQDKVLDQMIQEYPEYYQIRQWSGGVKNRFDVEASEKRFKEALDINPRSFAAHVSLAFLHFPTSNNFFMLAEEKRDLKKAEELLIKGSKIHPESSRWSRFLGNVYRAQGDFDKALSAYKESLQIIEKHETGNNSDPYANSLLMVGHVNTFQGNYREARKYYDQAISISNNYWKYSITELKSHTYIYQKDFSNAVMTLSEMQNEVKSFDEEELTKINFTLGLEFTKFLAFGHSQKMDETLVSLDKSKKLREKRKIILLENAVDESERNRITLNTKIQNVEGQIWFNILFGNYEDANNLMISYKKLKDNQLEYNANALKNFYSFKGYLSLMEGNPEESIIAYSNLSNEDLGNDGYHSYFLALAKKATGQNEESKAMFISLANDNFATWQNAIVKNLAKAQIKTNI